MRPADYITPNFNANMSMAAVFLDSKKAFDTTWHSGLIHKLSDLEFLTGLIKLIASFLTGRIYSLGRRQIFYAKKYSGRVSQGSVFAPVLCSLYTNDAPMASGNRLALFTDDTCILMTET
jgi:hypothetical protein